MRHLTLKVTQDDPSGGNKYKTVFWLSGRIWKGEGLCEKYLCFLWKQQYQVIYVYTVRSKLTWIITQVATIKHFCRSVRYSGKLLPRCRQWLTKNYRQSHYPCLSASAKKYTSNESLCLTHLHSPGQNDWSLKHSWTNTHGGLNQAKPDHQADSSQFVLRFNKTDKNHQRGSVRHYSALLYE